MTKPPIPPPGDLRRELSEVHRRSFPMKSSIAAQRLTRALLDAGAPEEMIDRAKIGYYGDFTSPLVFPISELVKDAEAAGLKAIAEAAKQGAFDGRLKGNAGRCRAGTSKGECDEDRANRIRIKIMID